MTTLIKCLDVNEIYKADNKTLLEMAFPRNLYLETLGRWFRRVGQSLETSPAKIKNIYYGTSKLTSIEEIYIQDLARRRAYSQPDPRQTTLELVVCNG